MDGSTFVGPYGELFGDKRKQSIAHYWLGCKSNSLVYSPFRTFVIKIQANKNWQSTLNNSNGSIGLCLNKEEELNRNVNPRALISFVLLGLYFRQISTFINLYSICPSNSCTSVEDSLQGLLNKFNLNLLMFILNNSFF